MRPIDADAVLEWFAKYWAMQKKLGRPSKQQQAIYMTMRTMVNSVKTVDAVPVIRCKDCKWLGVANLKDKYGQPNPVPCCRGKGNIRIGIKPDDYCSRGERKEDD